MIVAVDYQPKGLPGIILNERWLLWTLLNIQYVASSRAAVTGVSSAGDRPDLTPILMASSECLWVRVQAQASASASAKPYFLLPGVFTCYQNIFPVGPA